MQEKVLELLSGRKGHFLLESGHHGEVWLDLESLCLQPQRAQAIAGELSTRLSNLRLDAVCGPLVEGAFVALMVALKLGTQFTYTERFASPTADGLFPANYRVPTALRDGLRGKRVAIVNDVINAGSAIRGTLADLEQCGAIVVAIGTLLILGSAAPEFAASKNIPLHTLATLPTNLWIVAECPLCASGVPFEDVASFSTALRA